MNELLGNLSAEQLHRLPKNAAALCCSGADTRILRRLDYLSDPVYKVRAIRIQFLKEHSPMDR